MKSLIAKTFNKLGYSIHKNEHDSAGKNEHSYPDIKEKEFWDIYTLCKELTMTSVERMYSLYSAVNYILNNNIEGSFVECGVWRGGSALLIAKMLSNRKIFNRKLFLYDTFEGMPAPTKQDKTFLGEDAGELLRK